jgi:microsomal epoxide hydrolase
VVSPRPITIQVPDEELARLRARLAETRWPDQPPDAAGAPWAHGTDLGHLRGLVEHWRDGFDWRAHERALLGPFLDWTS